MLRADALAILTTLQIACNPTAPTTDLRAPIPAACDTDELRACMRSEGDCVGVDVECRTTASGCIEFALLEIAVCPDAIECSHLAALERCCVAVCEADAQACFAEARDFDTITGCYDARSACARECPDAGAQCPE